MDITTEKTLIATVKFTEADIRAFLVDPAPLQAQLRAALQPIGAERARASGRKKRDPVMGKQVRRPKGRGIRARTMSTRGNGTSTPCTICGKLLRPKYMAYHRRRRHPESVSAATV